MKTLKDIKTIVGSQGVCIPTVEKMEKIIKDRIKELEVMKDSCPRRKVRGIIDSRIDELRIVIGEEVPKLSADKLMVKTVHADAVTKID